MSELNYSSQKNVGPEELIMLYVHC